MHRRNGDWGVHGLGVGVFEEARVRPPKNAFVMRVHLDVDNLLVMGTRNGNGGGDPYFDWCVDSD